MKKIEFYSSIPGVVDMYPVKKIFECLPQWVSNARSDYVSKNNKFNGRVNHIYQCPGIFDLFKYGYVIPMWHDVIIKTDGSEGFSYSIPSTDLNELRFETSLLESQSNGLEYLMPIKPWSINTLIKINTPWNIVAPRGVKFLILPISYPDSFEFESCTGILDPSISNEVNIQLFYNVQKGNFLLKAGTPLAHLIPLSENSYELICREMNSIDKFWNLKRKFFNSANFKIRRNLIKDIYYKHFRK
jgi:hypothetical protein